MNTAITTPAAQLSTAEFCCEVRQAFHGLSVHIKNVGTDSELGLLNALMPMARTAYLYVIDGNEYAAKDLAAAARCLLIGATDLHDYGTPNSKNAWVRLSIATVSLELQVDRNNRA